MENPQNELKAQCEKIVESIGQDRFNPYIFIEKHPQVPPSTMALILKEVAADAPVIDRIWEYAEKVFERYSSAGDEPRNRSKIEIHNQLPTDQPPLPPPRPNPVGEASRKKAPSSDVNSEKLRPSPGPFSSERGKGEQGWVKLYRKLLDHPIFKSKDDKLFKTFIYCLLRAGHKETEIFFNHQSVKLKPGEFITGREKAARDLGFSPKTFDRKVSDLQIMQIMTRYMTRRFSIISITNWDTYQGKPEEDDPPNGTNLHLRWPQTRSKEEEKDPSEISSEISILVSKLFPGERELFDQTVKAISSTRKTGKLAQGVIPSLLKKFEKFPQENIQAGIRIYLEKAYHTQGKGEKYLLGIIRNHRTGETKPSQEFKSSGSPTLDAYYRKQAERGAKA